MTATFEAANPTATMRSEVIQETGQLIATKVVIVVIARAAAATERTKNQKVIIPDIRGQEIAG